MKKNTQNAYKYDAICPDCGKETRIYFTLADFYDAPIITKCKCCDTLYWHTPEDEYYIRPLEKQIEGKKCIKCEASLSEVLVPNHRDIKCKCCKTIFSLADNFADSMKYDSPMEEIEVYLIYST